MKSAGLVTTISVVSIETQKTLEYIHFLKDLDFHY